MIRGGQESIVQGIGRIRSEADIADTVVAVKGEIPVRVGQLGVVQVGPAIKRGTGSASFRTSGGEAVTTPAVIIAVQKQPNANTLELTAELDKVLDELERNLPAGMAINKNLFGTDVFLSCVYVIYAYTVLKMRMTSEFIQIMHLLTEFSSRLLGVHTKKKTGENTGGAE